MEGEKPPVLYLILGKTYSAGDLEAYIRDLKHLRRFKFVVIAYSDLSIVGYIPYYSLESILGLEGRASAFLNLIARNDVPAVKRYPGIRTVFLTPRTTNREALQLMLNERLESLLVLDHKQKLRGVVEREQLVGQLLLDLGS
jgi:CBS domain-containing protein